MSSHLCLTFSFLDPVPQYHGRDDIGEPEWPPSPLRMMQAMVCAAANSWSPEAARARGTTSHEAMLWLERQQFTIVAPKILRKDCGFRMYVPNNCGDLMTASWSRGDHEASMAKYRVEKDVRPTLLDRPAVHYLTSQLPESAELLDGLIRTARAVTHLGWGVDMVCGNATVVDEVDSSRLEGERWLPTTAMSLPLRIPISGTCEHLLDRHQAFLVRLLQQGFKPVPPLTAFRTVHYRRATDPIGKPFCLFELRNRDNSFFRYPQRHLMHIAGMVRHLAIKQMAFDPPEEIADPASWVDTYVAGHRRDISDAESHRQLSYIPLPSIGHHHADPSVRRVMIIAPYGDEKILDHLANRLDGEPLTEDSSKPSPCNWPSDRPPVLTKVRQPQHDKVSRLYSRSSNIWSSVTPVILPGHDDHKPQKTQKLILAALSQAGIEQPCKFEWSPFSRFPKSYSAHKYDRSGNLNGYFRPNHLLTQTAVHLTLRFDNDVKVAGPLTIGAGAHVGLGTMAVPEAG